jgi:hypothetical protein
VVGGATLSIAQEAGGLTLKFGQEVKVWRTFDTSGNGIAPRGRLFGGILTNRSSGHKRNIKTWELDCQSYNVLLARIVRDGAAAQAISLSAGTFVDQVEQLTEIIQKNGYASVANPIDATTQVVNLYGSMPAITLDPGFSYGYYLKVLCQRARELSPGIKPSFFLDTGRTFGVAESFGGAVLFVYDAALTPASLYDYDTDPTGSERQIYGEFKRTMEAAGVVNRRQMFLNDELLVTHAETASGSDYPNGWINHGLTGNKGYWMAEPLDADDDAGWTTAQAAVRGEVQKTAYPRETIEFDVEEHLLPGDVVTVTNALEGISAQTMRVVEASWDFESNQVSPWMHIVLGARILRLGEDGEEVLVPPTVGDVVPPGVPTWAAGSGWILQNVVDPATATVTVEVGLTLAEPGDMSHYLWRYFYLENGVQVTEYATTLAGDKTLLVAGLPPNRLVTFDVTAWDTSGNGSLPSATNSLTTTTLSPPTALSVPTARMVQIRDMMVAFLEFTPPTVAGLVGYEWGVRPPNDVKYYALPPLPADAVEGRMTQLMAGQTGYSVRIRAVYEDEQRSAYASTTFNTIIRPRAPHDPPTFDTLDYPDLTLAGWSATNTTGTVDWAIEEAVAAHVGKRYVTADMSAGLEAGYLLSPPIACTAGVPIVPRVAVIRLSGASTVLAAVEAVFYNSSDVTTGTGTIRASGTLTTSWVESSVKVTPPAGSVYYRLKYTASAPGLGPTAAGKVGFSSPGVQPEVEGKHLAATMDVSSIFDIQYGASNRFKFRDQDGQEFAGIGTSGQVSANTATLSIAATGGRLRLVGVSGQPGIEVSPYLSLEEQALSPDTPDSGYGRLYNKADGQLYWKDDSGREYLVSPWGEPGPLVRLSAETNVTVDGSNNVEKWQGAEAQSYMARYDTALGVGTKPTRVTGVINGKAVVRFDGSDDLLRIRANSEVFENWCISAVVRPTSSAGSVGIMQWADALSSGNPYVLLQRNGTDVRVYVDGNYRWTIAHANNASKIYTFGWDGWDYYCWVDGTAQSAYTGGGVANKTLGDFIYFGNGFNGYYTGDIAEFVLHGYLPRSAELLVMHRRMGTDYGITVP